MKVDINKTIDMKSDLVKIVEDVWLEEGLDNGVYEVAALTCLQRLEELTNQRVIEELNSLGGLIQGADEDMISDFITRRIKELKQQIMDERDNHNEYLEGLKDGYNETKE